MKYNFDFSSLNVDATGIEKEIERIKQKVSESKMAIQEQGGTILSEKIENLPEEIKNIPKGAELPSVTEANNGDVLQVKDGTWQPVHPGGQTTVYQVRNIALSDTIPEEGVPEGYILGVY